MGIDNIVHENTTNAKCDLCESINPNCIWITINDTKKYLCGDCVQKVVYKVFYLSGTFPFKSPDEI